MEVRRIFYSEFDDYQAYLKEIKKRLPFITDPMSIKNHGKDYIVSGTSAKAAIAYDVDDKIQCSIIEGDEKSFGGINYDIGFYNYQILEDANYKCVTKTGKELGNIFRVKCTRQASLNNTMELEYSLFYDVLDEETAFHYTIDGTDDVKASIDYTLEHNPDMVYLRRTKRRTKRLTDRSVIEKLVKERLYHLSLNGEMYYRPLLTLNKREIGVFPVTYKPEDFFEKVGEEYFNREIPEDLKTLMTNTNENYNVLKLVADEYRKRI
ncbi:MAG: hypothetical protein J1F35_02375 [Erysipelotrichales bacterium]|nr:hypothetical protein [Erysipelotrichales bacterium]